MCEIEFDGGRADYWNETLRKARRAHRCACCTATVAPGSVYLQQSYSFDHGLSRTALCADCGKDMQAFGDAHGGWRFQGGTFLEELRNCISEYDPRDFEPDEDTERLWKPMLARIEERRSAAKEAT